MNDTFNFTKTLCLYSGKTVSGITSTLCDLLDIQYKHNISDILLTILQTQNIHVRIFLVSTGKILPSAESILEIQYVRHQYQN